MIEIRISNIIHSEQQGLVEQILFELTLDLRHFLTLLRNAGVFEQSTSLLYVIVHLLHFLFALLRNPRHEVAVKMFLEIHGGLNQVLTILNVGCVFGPDGPYLIIDLLVS